MHLFTPDERTRKIHLNTVAKALRQELAQASAPTVFRQLLPRIVRLAHECPFQDIKKGFQEFLSQSKSVRCVFTHPDSFGATTTEFLLTSASAFVSSFLATRSLKNGKYKSPRFQGPLAFSERVSYQWIHRRSRRRRPSKCVPPCAPVRAANGLLRSEMTFIDRFQKFLLCFACSGPCGANSGGFRLALFVCPRSLRLSFMLTCAQLFLQEIFLQMGRVSHLDRVLSWHPTYQVCFQLLGAVVAFKVSDRSFLLDWRN